MNSYLFIMLSIIVILLGLTAACQAKEILLSNDGLSYDLGRPGRYCIDINTNSTTSVYVQIDIESGTYLQGGYREVQRCYDINQNFKGSISVINRYSARPVKFDLILTRTELKPAVTEEFDLLFKLVVMLNLICITAPVYLLAFDITEGILNY